MARNITLKIWDAKDNLIHDRRIRVIDEYVTNNKIKFHFDEDLLQAIQDDTSYELRIDNIQASISKTYKEGKWMVIDYIGG